MSAAIPRRISFNTGPKYHNEAIVVKGLKFPSLKEARAWQTLQLLEKANRIRNLRRQVKLECKVNGKLVCRYIADFVFEEFRGKDEWVEVTADAKGFATPVYRLKKKLVAACLGIEIREM
jgi:hypothetical protein